MYVPKGIIFQIHNMDINSYTIQQDFFLNRDKLWIFHYMEYIILSP